jgi:AcrR family transcriptional regulator
VARTVDERHRGDLLERIVDYVTANGLADLSLRPLAEAVATSPRVLLYYFRSKEELIAEVLGRARLRQRELFASSLPRNPQSYAETIRAAWALMSAPQNEPVFRLFFEVYGLALQDRTRFAAFLHAAVDDWLAYLEAPALRDGYAEADARAIATVMLAGFRGFLLDLCATRERDRLAAAVELWIVTLDAIPPPEGLHGIDR